jgi:hypothetical protein
MKIEKIESLFENGNKFLNVVEGITENDVVVKTYVSPNNCEKAVDSKYVLDRSNQLTVYVTLKSETVDILKSANPDLIKICKYTNDCPGGENTYHVSQSKRFEFKFTGIRTRKNKMEKYERVYQEFLDSIPELTTNMISQLMTDLNANLLNSVDVINRDYTTNHVSLFTSNTYEEAWTEEFSNNVEFVKAQEEKEELQKQIDELKAKVSLVNEEITSVKCKITKDFLDKEELPAQVVEKINQKYDKSEAWKTYVGRNIRL